MDETRLRAVIREEVALAMKTLGTSRTPAARVTTSVSTGRCPRSTATPTGTHARPPTSSAPTLTGELWRWKWQHPGGAVTDLTPQQAAILQGFPSDRVWVGPKTRVALQIGNAIPPQLVVAAASRALAAAAPALEAA